MLEIIIPAIELWDERTEKFVYTKEHTIRLEHSLVSLSKWESKWGKPFLSKSKMTYEETIDYIKCMTISQNIDPDVYNFLSDSNLKQIEEYIAKPMTATTFSEQETKSKGGSNGEQVTAELIYYWMIALNIPFECQKWHLNKLLTLIRVCNIKNQPPKKMSKREILSQNAALNAKRRQKYNSKG